MPNKVKEVMVIRTIRTPRILIEVEGGIVQTVYSEIPVDILVRDYDKWGNPVISYSNRNAAVDSQYVNAVWEERPKE